MELMIGGILGGILASAMYALVLFNNLYKREKESQDVLKGVALVLQATQVEVILYLKSGVQLKGRIASVKEHMIDFSFDENKDERLGYILLKEIVGLCPTERSVAVEA